MAKESGIQNTWYGIRCWKVYAQGFASGWAGIMRYGAMYWTPLIVFFIIKGRSSTAGASPDELKHAGMPQSPSCCQTQAVSSGNEHESCKMTVAAAFAASHPVRIAVVLYELTNLLDGR